MKKLVDTEVANTETANKTIKQRMTDAERLTGVDG
jgi:hypothetical protein